MILTLSVSLLSACGWHLRGSGEEADIDQKIFLASASGKVYEQIQKTLNRKNAFADVASADIQLELGKEYFERRRASVNDQAQTTQYELSLSVNYEILDSAGVPLTKKTTANLERFFTFNQNAINSSAKEEQVLRKEMARQVARQILQRVNFLSRKKATPQ
jgi:LPS-assembly lipoprotein